MSPWQEPFGLCNNLDDTARRNRDSRVPRTSHSDIRQQIDFPRSRNFPEPSGPRDWNLTALSSGCIL